MPADEAPMSRLLLAVALALTVGSAAEGAVSAQGLSPAQSALAARRIAALRTPADRGVASQWTDAKKAAEFFCRPIALTSLKRQVKGADRVFLGTDDPGALHLVSAARLEGSGQVRAGPGWRDFTFVCRLNPRTGKAVGFNAILIQPSR
jgi:hypothetical protein